MGFNRFGLGFGRRSGSGLPQIPVISGGVLDRVGSTVNWTPWTYSVSGLDTNTTTFVLDGVDQAPGAITFPYTLAAGHTLGARGSATKVGYSPASPVADDVFNPLPTDIADGAWTYGENDPANDAISSTETRKTLISTAVAPQAGKEWRAYRGTLAGGDLAQLGTPLVLNTGIYSWVSGGQNSRGATVVCRIAETDIGGANPRWASSALSYTASNIPLTPAGVTISTGSTAGAINVSVSTDGDGRGRGILALYATINGGAAFALTPSGGAAGVRTFTAVGTEPVSISVFWRNANGDSAATAAVSVTPGVTLATIPTTMTNTYTYNGLTGTLSRAAPVGYFDGGQPFILSTGADYTITSTGIDSAVLDGYQAQGAMENPYIENVGFVTHGLGDQGFDAMWAAMNDGQSRAPYLAGVNINPAVAGPILVVSGSAKTIVQSVRLAGKTIANYPMINRFVPLTILPEAPPVGSIRPAQCSVVKEVVLNMNTFTDAGFANIAPVAGFPTFAAALARYTRDANHYRIRADPLNAAETQNTGVAPMDTNYSAYLARALMDLIIVCHFNTTTLAQRQQAAEMIGTHATDVLGETERFGSKYAAGAGQHHLTQSYLLAAAYMFGSTRMYNAALNMWSNMMDQSIRFTADVVGRKTAWPSTYGVNELPILKEMVGQAHFRLNQNVPVWGADASVRARYYDVSSAGRIPEILAVMLFNAVGSIPAGYVAITQGSGLNDRTSLIDMFDNEMARGNNKFVNQGPETRHVALYNAVRASIPVPRQTRVLQPVTWTGVTPRSTAALSRFTPVANGLAWNFADQTVLANPPATQLKLATSQDNVWFEPWQTVALSGSRTDLPPGTPSWTKVALSNGTQDGPPTITQPTQTGDPDQGYVLTGGAATGTPANISPPEIMYREYPATDLNICVNAGSVFPTGRSDIYVGAGKWSGNISAGFTKDVQTGPSDTGPWTDAGTVVASRYPMVPADPGRWIRPKVTVGGVTAYGSPVQIPALPVLPAGTIFRSDFDGLFGVRYAASLSGMTANSSGGTATHKPDYGWGSTGATPGGVVLVKNGAFARLGVPVYNHTVGVQYLIDADIPVDDGDAWALNGYFRLSATPTGTENALITVTRGLLDDEGNLAPYTFQLRNYLYTATNAMMIPRVGIAYGSSNTIGGDPGFSYMWVREA